MDINLGVLTLVIIGIGFFMILMLGATGKDICSRLERIAKALEASNARAEKKEPQRFVETFIVDGEFLGDGSFEEALDREIEHRLGKDIQIHDVQTTFYKMPDGILSFHGAVRTVIYSHR